MDEAGMQNAPAQGHCPAILVNLGVAFHRRQVIPIFTPAAIRSHRGARRKRLHLKTVTQIPRCRPVSIPNPRATEPFDRPAVMENSPVSGICRGV